MKTKRRERIESVWAAMEANGMPMDGDLFLEVRALWAIVDARGVGHLDDDPCRCEMCAIAAYEAEGNS